MKKKKKIIKLIQELSEYNIDDIMDIVRQALYTRYKKKVIQYDV